VNSFQMVLWKPLQPVMNNSLHGRD
jgi:hypothetical protein